MPSNGTTGGLATVALAVGLTAGLIASPGAQPVFDATRIPAIEAPRPEGWCATAEGQAARSAYEARRALQRTGPARTDDWTSLCRETERADGEPDRLCLLRSTRGGALCATEEQAQEWAGLLDANCWCGLCDRWSRMAVVFADHIVRVPVCPPSPTP